MSRPNPNATPRSNRAPWATPERVAILRETWPTYTHWRNIRGRLVAAGGPTLPQDDAIRVFVARTLGVSRPADFHKMSRKMVAAVCEPDRFEVRRPAIATADPLLSLVREQYRPPDNPMRRVVPGTYPAPVGGYSMLNRTVRNV